MPAPSSGPLRAGLAFKLSQVKLAARAYVRDRANQARSTLTSYAVAVGLLAAALICLLAVCLVGVAALFCWIDILYGLFTAFAAVAALLLMIAMILTGAAFLVVQRGPRPFPGLGRRLRVALTASPVDADQIEAVRDATATWLAAATPAAVERGRSASPSRSLRTSRDMQAAGILIATVLGWAAVRRRHHRQVQQRRSAA